MAIALSDLVTSTASYLENEVVVRVTDVTSNLNPGEEGTYTVTVTNAAPPTGVRLRNLRWHLRVQPASVAKLIPPGSRLINAREDNDINSGELFSTDRVGEMWLFFDVAGGDENLNDRLDVGEVMEHEFRYEAVTGPGDPDSRAGDRGKASPLIGVASPPSVRSAAQAQSVRAPGRTAVA